MLLTKVEWFFFFNTCNLHKLSKNIIEKSCIKRYKNNFFSSNYFGNTSSMFKFTSAKLKTVCKVADKRKGTMLLCLVLTISNGFCDEYVHPCQCPCYQGEVMENGAGKREMWSLELLWACLSTWALKSKSLLMQSTAQVPAPCLVFATSFSRRLNKTR